MTLVPTHSNNWIKIRFSGQTWSKLTKNYNNLEFDVKTWKTLFWSVSNQF